MRLYLFSVIAIAVITIITIYLYRRDENIKFLNDFGWVVSEAVIETEKIEIPFVFDEVFNNYNQLQIEAGLDLTKYKGKKGIRYTYEVLNYPQKINDVVRANVICINSKPVAGDIMTTSINGFMHSLKFSTEEYE